MEFPFGYVFFSLSNFLPICNCLSRPLLTKCDVVVQCAHVGVGGGSVGVQFVICICIALLLLAAPLV